MPIHVLFTIYNNILDEMELHLTEQMNAKKGLKHFGAAGAEAIMKELDQLIHRKVIKGRKARNQQRSETKCAEVSDVLEREAKRNNQRKRVR